MAMSVDDIHIERNGGTVTVRLNRPAKRNSLARPHLDFLRETLDALANDPAVRCLVLTGTGSAFCAGADVDEWAEAERNGELDTYGWSERAHAFVQALAAFPRPTIAALNGAAVGAGADVGFACDFRIASEAATLRCGYIGMGYSPDMGGSWFLPRIARPDVVRRFIFLNERWTARDAFAAGLVTDVVDGERFAEHVAAFAERLAQGPSEAFAHTKQLLAQSLTNTLAGQLRDELAAGVACGHSADGQEALRAAVEGRAPHFVGR
ncbi:enoyl-CoA hydratase/isomerase family protein [Burkholderia guangdongensis]|uniref:enoyl-CoA hydratase/isomerase family protein n=1 Tax=Burkholderia guangdongensis TaxID=1792500 RepID=UPI001FE390C8|nr:enoyl-CoA hydratase-related protein [Burkholderia guangdongensis]